MKLRFELFNKRDPVQGNCGISVATVHTVLPPGSIDEFLTTIAWTATGSDGPLTIASGTIKSSGSALDATKLHVKTCKSLGVPV
jgi:hypothetical protein